MKKQIIISVFMTICFSLTLISADTLVTSCRILTEPNTRYYMTGDVNTGEERGCFDMSEPNQTLDCQGNSIYGGDITLEPSGVTMGYSGSSIKNCRFTNLKKAIILNTMSNINITNNTFTALGDYADCITGDVISGIMPTNSISNSEISKNTFTGITGDAVCGSGSMAMINLYNATNVRILSNYIDGYNSAEPNTYYATRGIKISGTNNLIKDNIITNTYTAAISFIIRLPVYGTFNNNTIINLTQSNSSMGLEIINQGNNIINSSFSNNNRSIVLWDGAVSDLGGGGYNSFTNILITNSNIGIYGGQDDGGWGMESSFTNLIIINSTNYDIYDDRNDGGNIYFLNATYNISKELVGYSYLYRRWYYSAYVNDTNGNPVSNASIIGYDVFGGAQFSIFTNPTGYTNQTSILDYINSGDDGFGGQTRTYYSNYTIKAIDSVGHQASHSLNITQVQNYQDKFQLSCWSWLNRLFDYPSICGSDIDSVLKEIF